MNSESTVIDLPFADRIPSDLEADTAAILVKLATGRPLDAETYARIRARADLIRETVFQKHGLLDIGVPAIRELRDHE
jgi:hypothetical protein